MSYLKSARLNNQQIEREREVEKARYGRPYSSSFQSKPTPNANTNKLPCRNINTLCKNNTCPESATQLSSFEMGIFTVSSPLAQKRIGKPKPSTQNNSNKRPQTTIGIYEKRNNTSAIRKPGTANGKMANSNANSNASVSTRGPYSNEVGGFGKGDIMNMKMNTNMTTDSHVNRNSNNFTGSRGCPTVLPHNTKVAKNLKSYPTFLLQEKQRHQQQHGRRTDMTTSLGPRCRKSGVIKEDKHQDQSNQNQVSFQSQKCINVDITAGDTKPNSDKSDIPPSDQNSTNIIDRINEIGDGENVVEEEDTVKAEKLAIDEDKAVVITELYSRRSSSNKSNKGKSQVPVQNQNQNQGQMSPPTSAVSSSSEINTALQLTPLKTGGKREKPQVKTQQQPVVSVRRENTATKFEYRARMEEILAQPVRDLVSFSKGVLLLRHHDKLEGSLRLTNLTSEPICFRTTSSIANRYKIEPKIGVMDADASLAIRIRTKQVFKENTIKRDRFTIESAITPEFPMTNEQVLQFWKKISLGKVQKAQTNVTFIFDSADPKFRAILGGGTCIQSENQNKSSPIKLQVQTSSTSSSPSEIDKESLDVKKPTSSQLTTNSSRKMSNTCVQRTNKKTSRDILELISFDPNHTAQDETRILAANENQRGPVTSFLIFVLKACPIAAGFMFFVYQAMNKHNLKLLGSSQPT